LPNDSNSILIITNKSEPSTNYLKNKNPKKIHIIANALKIKYIDFIKTNIEKIILRKAVKDNFKNEEIFLKNENIKYTFLETHIKSILFEVDEKKYILIGSGNPSNNAKHEFYFIIKNNELYSHKINFINNISKHQTTDNRQQTTDNRQQK